MRPLCIVEIEGARSDTRSALIVDRSGSWQAAQKTILYPSAPASLGASRHAGILAAAAACQAEGARRPPRAIIAQAGD